MKSCVGLFWICVQVASATSILAQFSTTERSLGQFGNSYGRSGLSSSRSVLVNLAKSLSSSLKQSMAANNKQVLEVSKSIQDLEAAVEELKIGVELNSAKTEENANQLAAIAQVTAQIQDRRDLDEMVWTFNTIVCNASIEMIRQDMLMSRNTVANKSRLQNSREQIDTLIQETNNILLRVDEKYTNISKQITSQEEKILPPPKVSMDEEIMEKVNSKYSGLETRFDFLLKNLESALTGEDDDIRREINHKHEDIAIQMNGSSSRLSVFEVRMDVLEQLVLDIEQDKAEATTEDPLFGHDFSMLGGNAARLRDTTQRSAGREHLLGERDDNGNQFGGQVNFPRSQNPYSNQNNFDPREVSNSPGRSFFDSQQQQFDLKQAELLGFGQQQKRDGRDLSRLSQGTNREPTQSNMLAESHQQCECDELQLKVLELEEELSALRKETEDALSGLQETMTVLQHKIQEVDVSARGEGPAPCVATKEAANMAGMDLWCLQNCAKGNCPPNLCSCPPKR